VRQGDLLIALRPALPDKRPASASAFFVAEPFIARSRNKVGGTCFGEEHLISPFVVGAGNAPTEEIFV
jgi:hypothetical protein